MNSPLTLAQLGWHPYFQQQLSQHEWETCVPARIARHERSLLTLLTAAGERQLSITPALPAMTVGDWLLLDAAGQYVRLLTRLSLFARRAAGTQVETQLIAANIDTVFILCSLNLDFNLNRIERYLALAHAAHVEPVVVLSKADLCDEVEERVAEVRKLDALLMVLAVNCLDQASVGALLPWCGKGRTVALLGSSGVGKSTLVNALIGGSVQSTGAIRADDDKGRHTTTWRSLHALPGGALLLDTPGMRELQLADRGDGIDGTFPEIARLAESCRFADCRHDGEPGCAVIRALAAGELDERRLDNFRKLRREQETSAATLAEKRARERQLGRYYRPAKFTHKLKRQDKE